MKVVNGGVNPLVLVAGLEGMPPGDLGVVEFRVDDEGVLELGIAGLHSQARKAVDVLFADAARVTGGLGHVRNSEALADGLRAAEHRELAAFGLGDPHAELQ